jgi:hypothetical protein
MHVSRLRAHALGYLRSHLLDLEGTQAQSGQDRRHPGNTRTKAVSSPDAQKPG